MSRPDVLAPGSARRIYVRLIGYAKPYWRMFAISTLGMVFYAATEPLFASMMKPLLDGTFIDRNPEVVKSLPLTLLGIFIVRGIAGFINTYCLQWVGRRVVADLRQEMFEHLLRSPANYFDCQSTGQILAKLTYNVENVADAATSAITTLIRDGLTVIGLVAYMLYINVMLSAIFLLVGPAMGISIRYASQLFRRHSKRIQDRVGELTHVAQEAIDGHRVVKAFGGQARAAERFSFVNEKTRSLQMKMVATNAISVPLVQMVSAVAIAVIIYLSTMQGLREDISVGTFMSFILAMGLLLQPIKSLTGINNQLQRGIIAADSLFELIDSPAEVDTGVQTLARARGRVEIRGLTHVYDADKGPVLRDLNLMIEPGETLALVGRSCS